MIKRMHAAMAERGVALLDAPVSGGVTGAKAATLALWISGDKAAYEKCKPVIDAIGNQQSYLGPDVGSGTIAKLSHNVGGYILHALVAEVFSLGVKAGLDPVTLWQAIRNGAYNRIGAYDWATRKFLGGDVDDEPPGFALKLAHKDVSLALNMARELKVPMRLGNLALEDLVECANRGWENKDARIMMHLQLERAGVELNVDKERYEAAKKAAGL
jgi:3-hydroxyisobutyrate dehydrogenase-like beta-hydroxyacid dehydrogenase